jgi:hypothetical protein
MSWCWLLQGSPISPYCPVQDRAPEYLPGQLERRETPGFAHASSDGRPGTDFTEAINRALSVPVVVRVHNYLVTNLTIPAGSS